MPWGFVVVLVSAGVVFLEVVVGLVESVEVGVFVVVVLVVDRLLLGVNLESPELFLFVEALAGGVFTGGGFEAGGVFVRLFPLTAGIFCYLCSVLSVFCEIVEEVLFKLASNWLIISDSSFRELSSKNTPLLMLPTLPPRGTLPMPKLVRSVPLPIEATSLEEGKGLEVPIVSQGATTKREKRRATAASWIRIFIFILL